MWAAALTPSTVAQCCLGWGSSTTVRVRVCVGGLCLMASELRRHGVPLLCFDAPTDEALAQEVVAQYADAMRAHVVVCDWDPDPCHQGVLERLAGALTCPLVALDSAYWSLRVEGLEAADVKGFCEDVARNGGARAQWLLSPPALGCMDAAVQRALQSEAGGMYVPRTVTRALVDVPLSAVDVAAAKLEAFLAFSRECGGSFDAEKKESVRRNEGVHRLLQLVDAGVLPAARAITASRLCTQEEGGRGSACVCEEVGLLLTREDDSGQPTKTCTL